MSFKKGELAIFLTAQMKIQQRLGFTPKHKTETNIKTPRSLKKKVNLTINTQLEQTKNKHSSIITPQSITSKSAFKINTQRRNSPKSTLKFKSPTIILPQTCKNKVSTPKQITFTPKRSSMLNSQTKFFKKKQNELNLSKLDLKLSYLIKKIENYQHVPKINKPSKAKVIDTFRQISPNFGNST